MERLTKRTYTISEPHVEMVTAVLGVNVTDIIDRLAAYEDADEQGLLVRLPCKVGDTVYRVVLTKIYEIPVFSMVAYQNCLTICDIDGNEYLYPSSELYLSREEAEAALAKEREP